MRIDGRGAPRAAGKHPITRGWGRGFRAAHGAARPVDRRPLLGDDLRRRLLGGDGPTYSAEHGQSLKGLAEADLVHGDCKPSNFLVSDKDEIILTDSGRAASVMHLRTTRPSSAHRASASSSALRGEAPSPSDDLEACAYALAYLLTGRLPFVADYDDRTTLKASSDSSLADAKDAVAPDLLCASSRKGEAPFDAAARVCAAFLREARLARGQGRDPDFAALVPSFSDVEPDWRAAGVSWDDPGRYTWRTTARNLLFCVFVFALLSLLVSC